MKFIIISPAYNEADHIHNTIESVIKQNSLPEQWIIVNDGSTDSTSQIIKKYSKNYKWIKLIDSKKEDVGFGTHAVVNFNKGLKACDIKDWEFVMKLDTDLDIDRDDFFKFQLNKFKENEKLGICSGITYSVINGEKKFTLTRPYWRTGGAMKFYRRVCFEQMGGLVPIYGWDGIDEYKAMFHGWQTRTFFELPVNHLGKPRAIERSKQVWFAENKALSFYLRGYPIEFILLKSIGLLIKNFPLCWIFLKSYWKAYTNNISQVVTKEEKRFIRKIQYARILERIIHKKLL